MGKTNSLQNAVQKPVRTSKIPSEAARVKNAIVNHDNEPPLFSFKHVCRNNCLLSEWQQKEIDQLIQRLKLLEQLSWKEIKVHKGLNFKPVDNYIFALPTSVPLDSVIHELKVDDKKRLLGFREGRIFCFVWFDRNHAAIPMNKSKTKR